MNHRKKAEIDRLMNLLGCDPSSDVIPENFAEAAMFRDTEEQKKGSTRLDNGCGKVCYTSEGACRKAISRRLNKGSNVSRLRTYRCPTCDAWHMSSSFQQRKA